MTDLFIFTILTNKEIINMIIAFVSLTLGFAVGYFLAWFLTSNKYDKWIR